MESIANYLGFTTNDLLDAYGSGDHIPGAGSAAALSALLAFELLRTVCILSLRKKTYEAVHKELREILRNIEEVYRPRMRRLFDEDIRVFRLVSANRILRDAAVTPTERDRYNRVALRHQRTATTVPIQICETAFEALELAIRVYDIGFK
ncbi:MAG: cyclodeaminase/cyclohydrolase family protein, partial [Acidobacteriota bacterium]